MHRSVAFRSLMPYLSLLIVLLLMILGFGWASDRFLRWSTVTLIANQLPDLTFLAVGMTFVLILRGIDLSVGSLLAISAATFGLFLSSFESSIGVAVVAACLLGMFCGFANGALTFCCNLPSFIVTLAMLEIARGCTKLLTDSKTIYLGSRVEWFGQPLESISVSPAFVLAIAMVVLAQFLLSKSVFGRYCIAVGTNAEAVRMSGLSIAPYPIVIFTLSGLMSALAGLTQVSRMASVDPNAGVGIELSAIAACVIGGTSLMGGRGNVVCTFLGVLIMQVLQTGLVQLGVSDAGKQIITGSVIVIAALVDILRQRIERKTGSDG